MNDGSLRTAHRVVRAIIAIGFAPIPAHATEAPQTSGASQMVTGRRTVSVASDGRGLTLDLLEGGSGRYAGQHRHHQRRQRRGMCTAQQR